MGFMLLDTNSSFTQLTVQEDVTVKASNYI
jgi:hypothetical protein